MKIILKKKNITQEKISKKKKKKKKREIKTRSREPGEGTEGSQWGQQ